MKKLLHKLTYKLERDERKIITLASLGGMLEFYDFTIYGLFSIYFAEQYFPMHNEALSIIASFVIFIIGYIARPIGGILFSHIGDAIGRKFVLIVTMLIMGLASLTIGLIPTYEKIGIFAPILLLTSRLLQGLAIGGELPSMIVYVTESMPKKRGYAIGGILAGTDSGLLLGLLINFIILHTLNHQQIYDYGWRIPFIAGGILCFVSYIIRKNLHETKAFDNIKEKAKLPIVEVITKYPLQVLTSIGITGVMAAFVMIAIIFMPTFISQLAKIDNPHLSIYLLIATFLTVVSAYFTGLIANHYNPKRIMLFSLFGALISVILAFKFIQHSNDLLLGLCILTICQGIFATLSPLLISYIFPANVRLTGVAVSYNLGHTLFGGMAPIIITWLISKYHITYTAPVIYLICIIIISLISLRYLHRSTNLQGNI